MIGNFYELGPYIVQGVDGRIKRNEWAWNNRCSFLAIALHSVKAVVHRGGDVHTLRGTL